MQNNNNRKQKQHQDDADPTSNKKEVTDHEETATSSNSTCNKDKTQKSFNVLNVIQVNIKTNLDKKSAKIVLLELIKMFQRVKLHAKIAQKVGFQIHLELFNV